MYAQSTIEKQVPEELKNARELTHAETVGVDVGANDENQNDHRLGKRYWLSPMFMGTYMVRECGETQSK